MSKVKESLPANLAGETPCARSKKSLPAPSGPGLEADRPAVVKVAWGGQGRIFSYWASANQRPYRAVGPPSGAVSFRESPLSHNNYLKFSPLYGVLKRVLRTRIRRYDL